MRETSRTRQRRLNRHSVALLMTAVLALAILYLTLMPQPPRLRSVSQWDKAYHLVAFAGLVLPASLLYRRSLILVIPAALILGGLIEVIQPAFGRSSELADFLADGLGVGLGVIMGAVLRPLVLPRA